METYFNHQSGAYLTACCIHSLALKAGSCQIQFQINVKPDQCQIESMSDQNRFNVKPDQCQIRSMSNEINV